MPDINISGYLRFNPEMRYTQSVKAITTFKLYDNKDDYLPYKYEYKIVTWEKLAEKCNELLISGDYVYAKGYWKVRSWQKQDGKTISVNEFTAKSIVLFLDSNYFDLMAISNEVEGMLQDRHYEYFTSPKFDNGG